MPWLTYEREGEEWEPLVTYGDRPPMFIPHEGRTEPVEIPDDCFDPASGEPRYGEIRKRFPAPRRAR